MNTLAPTITRDYIEKCKIHNPAVLYSLLKEQKTNGLVVYILHHLGRLPSYFDGTCFLPLLHSKDDTVRYLAVKNIGKLSNPSYLEYLATVVREDPNSLIRREAVSSIGRMRFRKAIPILLSILNESDPKVVLQAIRALIIFKSDPIVNDALINLKSHPNETIQYVINKEFTTRLSSQKSTTKHTESPDFMKNVIVHGDVREILKYVPDESIHLTVTSPYYVNLSCEKL